MVSERRDCTRGKGHTLGKADASTLSRHLVDLANSPGGHRPRWITLQSLHSILHIPHPVLGLGCPFARHPRTSVRLCLALEGKYRNTQPLFSKFDGHFSRSGASGEGGETMILGHLRLKHGLARRLLHFFRLDRARRAFQNIADGLARLCTSVVVGAWTRTTATRRCGCGERYALSVAESCRSSVAVP
jgi:hypothetical protein